MEPRRPQPGAQIIKSAQYAHIPEKTYFYRLALRRLRSVFSPKIGAKCAENPQFSSPQPSETKKLTAINAFTHDKQ
ncbi:hypothetical protein C1Y43_23135 [Pantoea sp. ICBG 828]|nr:hypothetical protein C1Y43_23135 [Pantoea sp. ICBG 828]